MIQEPANAAAPTSSSPRAAAAAVRESLAAVPSQQPAARAELLRQSALVSLDLDDARGGLADARRAVRLAALAGDRQLEGRCRIALTRALGFVGRLVPALAEADRARVLVRGADLGRLEAQRAVVLYKMGDHVAALRTANIALRLLPADSVDTARALNNRGIVRLYLGGYREGLADFARARAWYQSAGMAFSAAEVRTNIGMMLDRLGDVVGALAELEEAAAELQELQVPVDRDIVYRAEVLLAARLYDEVRSIVPAAVASLEAAGMQTDAAEGRLYLAEALVLAGAPSAIAEARRARQAFQRGRRWGWAALARLAEMRARLDAGERTAAAHRDARHTALALRRAGLGVQERDAWLLAGRFATRVHRTDDAIAHWRDAARPHPGAPLAERLVVHEARARLARLRGDEAETLRECQRGLTLIEEHVAALAATDLRVSASDRGQALADIAIGIAWRRRDPRLLFRWLERWRGAALWLAPVRPPPDARLARLLTELRAASLAVREAGLDDDPATDGTLERERVRVLERAVLAASRTQPPGRSFAIHRRAEVADVHAPLGPRAMVELVGHGGGLGALVLAGGRITFHELGPLAPIAACADALRFSLDRLARIGGGAAGAIALDSARARLDDLRRLVGDPLRCRIDGRELVVVPDLALGHLPWSWILGDGQATSVAPSASLWHRAATSPSGPGGHVTVVAGPGLVGARTEADRIAALYPAPRRLIGRHASVDAVGQALDGARIAHLATHGTIRRDNPLFSTIELADGPALVHDLERIGRPPEVIVLASCYSALGTWHASNDVVGLAAALLTAGARVVVAAAVPLPDLEIVALMVDLHAQLAAGRPPAAALATTCAHGAVDDAVRFLARGALVCFGAG